jgi:peroxygenase
VLSESTGVLWPHDTFIGFRRLGFNLVLSLLALFIIHANFSYPTVSGWLPDPFFRIYLRAVHKDKHGSDTGTYDHEGRFVPQKFEDVFAKYAGGREYLTLGDVWNVLKGQRCVADPVGWGGAFFECEYSVKGKRECALMMMDRDCDIFDAVAGGWEDDEGRYKGRV